MTQERSSRSGGARFFRIKRRILQVGEGSRGPSRSERGSGGGREEDVLKQGETPGPGEYRCVTCNEDWQVTLESEKSRLPPCGKCGPGVTAEYEKVGR